MASNAAQTYNQHEKGKQHRKFRKCKVAKRSTSKIMKNNADDTNFFESTLLQFLCLLIGNKESAFRPKLDVFKYDNNKHNTPLNKDIF